MRVLLVDPSSRGGIASYTRLVTAAVAAAGGEPMILTSRAAPADANASLTHRWIPEMRWDRPANAGIGFFAGRMAGWCGAAAATAAAVQLLRPDVIHFQAPFNRRLDTHLLRYLHRRAAVVWTAHDVLPHEHTSADERRFREIYRTVDAVVVHVEPAADAIRQLAQVEATVIQHGAPDAQVAETADEARAKLALPPGERMLAALGFIRPYKGYELLAEVWERLGARAPLLLVMGEAFGSGQVDVLERLRRAPRTIVRLGYAAEFDLHLAVRSADALVLPYAAGSDSGLLHLARALGVPVLASDAPQLAASVRATRAGVVVPRTVEAWADAVCAPIPGPPPAPAAPRAIGEAHLALYRRVVERRAAGRKTVRP